MKTLRMSAALLATVTLLTACGENTTDRAATGAAIGAVTGAVVGSTVGHGGAGAVLGGAAGAAVGGMTTSDDVNLGKPVWR